MGSTTEPPQAQVLEALTAANNVRTAKAKYKRKIEAGTITAEEALTDPPSYIHNTHVGDFLKWIPKIGEDRAQRIANGVCRWTMPIAAVDPRVRNQILDRLGRYTDDCYIHRSLAA